MKNAPRIITIVARENGAGDFDVHEGEKVVTRLTWDEMLGTIAVITHPQIGPARQQVPPYRMQSIDAVMDWHVRLHTPATAEDFKEVGS